MSKAQDRSTAYLYYSVEFGVIVISVVLARNTAYLA